MTYQFTRENQHSLAWFATCHFGLLAVRASVMRLHTGMTLDVAHAVESATSTADATYLVELIIKGATLEVMQRRLAGDDPFSYMTMFLSLRGPMAQMAFVILDDVSAESSHLVETDH